MLAKVHCSAVQGIVAHPVEVEVNDGYGETLTVIVGLPDANSGADLKKRAPRTGHPDLILRNQVVDDPAVNIRQPEIATGVAVGEFFVIEAQHRQHRGVQVVHMHPVSSARNPNSSVAP